MKFKLAKLLSVFIYLALLVSCASNNMGQNNVFDSKYSDKSPKEYAGFVTAKASGKIEAGRKQLINSCINGEGHKTTDCNCFADEFSKISDEEFYYESIQSYTRYKIQDES